MFDNLPPFMQSLAFWKSASLVIATLVVFFFPDYKLEAAGVEAIIYALLGLLGIKPEIKARALK